MKNIFGICEGAQSQTCDLFRIRSLDSDTQAKKDRHFNALSAAEKKSSLPIWLIIVKWVTFALFAIIALNILAVGFPTAWKNAPALFFIGAGCGILALILYLCEKKKGKNAETPEVQTLLQEAGQTADEAQRQLSVPDNALQTDILTYSYRLKNGKEKRPLARFYDYLLLNSLVFTEGNMLCIYDHSNVYGIPIDEITAIRKHKKRTTVSGWNKMAPPDDPAFKAFRVQTNGYGMIFLPPCSVVVRHGEEDYEFLVPSYEAEKIGALCGVPVTEAEK